MAFTYVTVTETYEVATDVPARGTVEFDPVDQMHNGITIVSAAVSDDLDTNGTMSVRIAATTDPATRPVGVTYKVTEKIVGQPTRIYYVSVPHDQGSTLQLSSLPALATGGTAGFALRNATDYDDSVSPTDGQAMVWDTPTGKFHPETVSGVGSGVASVNGQTGTVTISNATLGAQPADSDLTAIAALAPTDGSLLQRVAGAWTSRTPTQVKGDLALDLVSNTSDAAKPISTATANALALKAPLADPTFTGTPTAPRFVGSVVAVTYAASVSLNASLGTTFRCVATGNLAVTAVTAGFQGQEIKLEVQASGANRTVTVLGVASTVNSGTWATWLLTYNQGLDQWTQIPPGSGSGGAVTSVNGQTGAVTLTAATVGAQAADQDLTDFAALTPANGDLLERVAGVWTSRSAAQVKADLALDQVNNTADVNKPLSTAATAALAAKAPLADPAFTGTPTAPRFVGAVATVAYAASITLNASLGSTFRVTATGDITSVAITNGAQGQEVKLQVLASGATRTVTAFGVATTVNSGTWATIPFTYNQGLDLWTQDSSGSGGGGAVSSVNGLTGAVTLTAASLSAQPADSDLTAIAALAPTDGSVLERVAGAWTARTPIQIKGDLALDQVNNTSDAAKPLSTAASTALAAKAPIASPTFTGTPTAPRFVGAVVTVPYSPSITLDAAAATTFRCVATGDVALTDILNGAPGQTVRLAVRASGAARNVTAAGSITNVPDGQWWVSTFTYDQATDGWIQDPTGGSGGGGGSGAVSSVNGLTGAVTLTAAGLGAQAADSDLTSIAALSPTDGSVLERVGGVWVARTAAQLKADLALDQVSNTADAAKPVSTATQAALDAKAPIASPTFTGTAAAPRFVGTVVTVAYAASVTLDASAGTVFRCTAPGDLTLADITGGANGQTVRFEVFASGATRTVTASGTATAVPAGQTWVGEFTYNSTKNEWLQDPVGGGGGGGGTGAVSSVNGQTGAVTLTATSLSAQPIDSDLTTIAALAPTDGSLLSRQAGAWTGRTTAQVKTDLGIATDISAAVAGLVNSAPSGLDTLGEIATALTADEATAAALATTVAGKAPLASPTFTGTASAPRFVTTLTTLTAVSGTITPDAAVSSAFLHTAAANVALADPTNGVAGQQLEVLVYASGGDRVLTVAGSATTIPAGTYWWGHYFYDLSRTTWVLDDSGSSASAVTPETYGAVGDGTADDTAEVQAAVNAASPGRPVLLTKAYRLTAPVTVPSGVRMHLEHGSALIRDHASTGNGGGTLINSDQTNGNTDIALTGTGRIYSASSSATGKHISFVKVTGLRLVDFGITGIYGDWNLTLKDCTKVQVKGLRVDSGAGILFADGLHLYGGSDITVADCQIRAGDDAISMTVENSTNGWLEDIAITNCVLESTNASGIKIDSKSPATTGVRRVNISNIAITHSSAGVGVWLRDQLGNSVSDITMDNVTIDSGAATNTSLQTEALTRFTASNVTIRNPNGRPIYLLNGSKLTLINPRVYGQRNTTVVQHDIRLDGTTDVAIEGGNLTGATSNGIMIGSSAACTDTLIHGTTIDTATGSGVRIVNGTGTRVARTRIKNCAVALTEDSPSTNNVVAENDMRGNTAGISALSSSNIVLRNNVGVSSAASTPSMTVPPATLYNPAVLPWSAANRAVFMRFYLPVDTVVRYLNWVVGTASGNVQLGIVKLASTQHTGFTRVADTGIIACPAAGDIKTDLGATTLAAGNYAAYLWADNTTFTTRSGTQGYLTAGRFAGLLSSISGGVPSSGTLGWSNQIFAVTVEGDV